MGLSDLILNKGDVILIESSSVTGLNATSGGTGLNFGTIQKVSDLSELTIGTSVMFNIEKAITFTIISGNYFLLVNERDIQLTEITPP